MHTDVQIKDKSDLLLEDDTYQIIGCAMNVSNELGHGFLEKLYENAMIVEFKDKNISFEQQKRFEVYYKKSLIGVYVPDLVIKNQIVVDIKTIERIGNSETGQMLNYLKVTGLKVGLILNFRHAKLEWHRVVL